MPMNNTYLNALVVISSALRQDQSSEEALEEILKLIELPSSRLTKRSKGVPTKKGIEPRNNIKLEKLSYKYPNSD